MTRNRTIKSRTAIALGVALFLVLADTGTGFALWRTAVAGSATVTAGTVAVAQSGFDSAGFSFSRTATTATGQFTIANNGNLSASYSARLSYSTGSSSLAAAALVDAWVKPATEGCTVPSPTALHGTWAAMPALTGAFDAGTLRHYCVRTTLEGSALKANSLATLVPALTITSTLGSWSATAAASTTLSVADTAPPTVPGTPIALATTGNSISLVWPAATDDVAVTAYQLSRNGVPVATLTGSSYTDTSVKSNATYTYAVIARDAAGNESTPSPSLSATAGKTDRYFVGSAASGCVDVPGKQPAVGTVLITQDCDSARTSQQWQLISDGNGSFTIRTGKSNRDWTANAGGVELSKKDAGTAWSVIPLTGDRYRIIDAGEHCLATGSAGTPLLLAPCGDGSEQTFTLTAVS